MQKPKLKKISVKLESQLDADTIMTSSEEEFQQAVKYVQTLPKVGSYKMPNETKLLLYGTYKQATLGECTTKRPGFLKFYERGKWDAWHKLEKMSKTEAMKWYVDEFMKVKAEFEKVAGQQGS